MMLGFRSRYSGCDIALYPVRRLSIRAPPDTTELPGQLGTSVSDPAPQFFALIFRSVGHGPTRSVRPPRAKASTSAVR